MKQGFYYGDVLVGIPDGCPDPDRFTAIVTARLDQAFGNPRAAAEAWQAYNRCTSIPEPFMRDYETDTRTIQAQLSLSPPAQAWCDFRRGLEIEFSAMAQDGQTHTPAIPGWERNGEILIGVPPWRERDQGRGRDRER